MLSIVDVGACKFWAIPAIWPPSAADDFLLKSAVTTARRMMLEGEPVNEARYKANAEVLFKYLTERVGIPESAMLFTDVPLAAQNILRPAAGYGQECIDTLTTRGYKGNFLPSFEPNDVIFRDWGVLVSVARATILNLPSSIRDFIKNSDLMKKMTLPEDS